MPLEEDQRIGRSWECNADRWTKAVRSGAIRSRAVATDPAIVDAVTALRPRTVLDLGCGEGWLVRRLARDLPCRAVGVDGSADLISHARAADPEGDYRCIDYAAIESGFEVLGGPFDVIVANFALLSADIAGLLRRLSGAAPRGALILQTVHPVTACGDAVYADGWREESFAAFGSAGWQPMPWFFRTLGTWHGELRDAGWRINSLREPLDPQSGKPLSLLLTCRSAR